jgi:TonB family protein
MSNAIQVWTRWRGQTVAGKFPLGDELGSSAQSAVFVTECGGREHRPAAIKLFPATGRDDDAQLARWAEAAKLDHPHLLRLFESGRCKLDGASYLFVVMEYAEEVLSQILPERPLSPAEAPAVLRPTLEVLGYLHQEGFVHGRIQPSNVMAVDNQLKISADGLFKRGDLVGKRHLTVYDAPEVSTAGLSPEADVWSLGVTLVATLTQRAPDLTNSNPPQALVPETVPQPFRDIAGRCLVGDPRRRATVAEIQARLQTPAPPASGTAEMRAEKEHSGRRMVLPAAIVIVLLSGLGLWAFLARRTPPPPADRAAQPVPPPSLQTQTQPRGTVQGKVSQQVVPQVPQSARDTIIVRIKVNVQVSVDPSGNVSEAKLVSDVVSKYFARLALESARQWRFTPAQLDGQAVASEWILRFRFGVAGTQVFPTEVRP